MTSPIDPSGVSGMLAEALSALDRMPTQPSGSDREPPTGTGEAADGAIRVRAALPGRIDGLRLEPRAMQLPAEELAKEIERAVNSALLDLQSHAGVLIGGIDMGGLTDRLEEIQFSAQRQFSAFTASLADAQEQLVRRAGGR